MDGSGLTRFNPSCGFAVPRESVEIHQAKRQEQKNLAEEGAPRFAHLISHLLQALIVLQIGEEWF